MATFPAHVPYLPVQTAQLYARLIEMMWSFRELKNSCKTLQPTDNLYSRFVLIERGTMWEKNVLWIIARGCLYCNQFHVHVEHLVRSQCWALSTRLQLFFLNATFDQTNCAQMNLTSSDVFFSSPLIFAHCQRSFQYLSIVWNCRKHETRSLTRFSHKTC